jgi:hypothetical protein
VRSAVCLFCIVRGETFGESLQEPRAFLLFRLRFGGLAGRRAVWKFSLEVVLDLFKLVEIAKIQGVLAQLHELGVAFDVAHLVTSLIPQPFKDVAFEIDDSSRFCLTTFQLAGFLSSPQRTCINAQLTGPTRTAARLW